MYHDTLIRIKNSQAVGQSRTKINFSKLDFAILKVLQRHHYLKDISKLGRGVKRIINIETSYHSDGKPKVSEIKFISKPSRRVYMGYKDLRPVRQGYGLGIISTPKGIMDIREARKQKLGGEYLFQIW